MLNDYLLVGPRDVLPSPMSGLLTQGPVLRIGAVQCGWLEDADTMKRRIAEGVGLAARAGASIVFLQELTLSPYFCVSPHVVDALDRFGEDLTTGPTVTFLRELAGEFEVSVHASLYERTSDGRGFNTAVCLDAAGVVRSRTRKTHIPEFANYHEEVYFQPSDEDAQVVDVGGVRYGFPTCWDQWFPELARMLSMDGAQVVVYPTAIGIDSSLPEFDSKPLWQQMIAANGLASATFMVAVNRIGTEGPTTFYGSSFVSDPFGRVLVEAPRDRPAVLLADLDLSHRDEMLTWGLLYTRRPERYGRLLERSNLGRPIEPPR